MKLGDLLAGIPLTGGNYNKELEIKSISYDTRTLKKGALFIALSGAKEEGDDYIQQAIEKGALAILSQRPPSSFVDHWIITPDTRVALAQISANWFSHPSEKLTMIGVTGTNGKTTTTYLLKEVLEKVLHTKVGLIGTVECQIGEVSIPSHRTTPESYELQKLLSQMVEAGCTHVVMEVSSHALVQHRVEGVLFSVGVFTNLTQDHLDYHITMEAYRQAKARLFQQSRWAVLNLDDEAGRWYAETVSIPIFTYSENKDWAHLTARNIRLFPSHVEFEVVTREEIERIHLPIPGGFTIYNALAAISCGLCLNLSLKEIAQALRSAHGVKGRIEVVPTPKAYTVLIDYAHTPNALENILLTARELTAGRLMCVFGCGGDRDRTKRAIMGSVVRELADVAILTSDNPRTENPWAIIEDIYEGMRGQGGEIHVEPDRRKAIYWALAQGRAGDVIVLAGKGHETYQEIEGVQYPMDEREIVASFYENKNTACEKTGNFKAGIV